MRRDGVALSFTNHVHDLEIDGVTCRAASGYTRSTVRCTAGLAVDSLDVESVFSADGIREEDLRTPPDASRQAPSPRPQS